MERDGFLLRTENGWWSPVVWAEDGRVSATLRTVGCHASRWKDYASEQSARAAAVRLVKKLEQTETAEQFNAVIQSWYAHN